MHPYFIYTHLFRQRLEHVCRFESGKCVADMFCRTITTY